MAKGTNKLLITIVTIFLCTFFSSCVGLGLVFYNESTTEAKKSGCFMNTYKCDKNEVYYKDVKYIFDEAFTTYGYRRTRWLSNDFKKCTHVFAFCPKFRNSETNNFDFFQVIIFDRSVNNNGTTPSQNFSIFTYLNGVCSVKDHLGGTFSGEIMFQDYFTKEYKSSPDSIKMVYWDKGKETIVLFTKEN